MTKFIAQYEGKIVGKRMSLRPYQFAVVVKDNEIAARDHAFNYKPTDTDRSNYDYALTQIAKGVEAYKYYHDPQAAFAREVAATRNGWEGYVESCRAWAIELFERNKKNGNFKPHVYGWSMSYHNAHKMADSAATPGRFVLAIVPAETR